MRELDAGHEHHQAAELIEHINYRPTVGGLEHCLVGCAVLADAPLRPIVARRSRRIRFRTGDAAFALVFVAHQISPNVMESRKPRAAAMTATCSQRVMARAFPQ